MRLKQLEALIAIQSCDGLAGAAAAMNLTVPAINKSMQTLEDEVGVPLLNREGYRVKLNDAGNCMVEYAKGILSEVEEAKRQARQTYNATGGNINLYASPGFLPYVVPMANCEFYEAHPTMTVSLQNRYLKTVFDEIKTGNIDLAICPIWEQQGMEGLEWEPLVRMQLKLVVGKDHPAAKAENITFEDLYDYHWLIPSGTGAPFNEVSKMFRELGSVSVDSLQTSVVPFWDAIFRMLSIKDFVAVLPTNDNILTLDPNHHVALDVDVSKFGWTHFIVRRKTKVSNPVLDQYIAILKSIISRNTYLG